MNTILRDADVKDADPVGGKAANLARLRSWLSTDLALIPPWFVLTPQAFDDSLPPAQREAFKEAPDQAHVILDAKVLTDLKDVLDAICPNGDTAAVRSSALEEDGRQHSFAGQLESFLFVDSDDVHARVVDVWRSAFSARVAAYRREHGMAIAPRIPAVVIQRMIHADCAGVAFGADPATGRRDVVVISAMRGVAAELVSGACEGETYRVVHGGNVDSPANALLSADQARAIANLAWSVGSFFGCPQDIEWAYQGSQLYLLQARPITTLGHDTQGEHFIWDNSNIAESYNGVTTPLTFSFARRAYEEVYRQFCRLLRVPEDRITRNDNVFRNMLGLIRGRVYYNLLNWYRALAMLPGFQFNRRFMEQMMGVKEPLPESVVAELAKATWRDRLRDGWNLLRSAAALGASHFTIEIRKRRFLKRLDDALGKSRPDLSPWRLDELARHYRDLERQLLPHWDAPLVNDFLAMIFFGSLRKCLAKWCGGNADALANDLLASEGGIVSSEPASAIHAMAATIRSDSALVKLLSDGALSDIVPAVNQVPAFREKMDLYLQRFGDRCFEELKLESPTLHDDPLPLLRVVALATSGPVRNGDSQSSDVRGSAEARVGQAIRWRPMRRLLFHWLLRNARARVRDRENLRLERTRLFGRARQIFLEFGERFHALGALDDPRDVFYLEVNEILGFVEGTATSTDLRGLAELRKKEFARYRQTASPPSRFETRGAVHQNLQFQVAPAALDSSSEERRGLGCSAGIVRGRARVVVNPRDVALQTGEILVAERTDPGWIMLFATAAGLVVERGSLLSHSAIVARELGLPAVISVPGVTAWLKDGDLIELDGSLGVVVRISRAEDVRQ